MLGDRPLALTPVEFELLASLATLGHGTTPANVTHYDISPTYDILLGVADRDLGGVAVDVRAIVARHQKDLPRGSTVTLRGQVASYIR